jgi:hypothetical protein
MNEIQIQFQGARERLQKICDELSKQGLHVTTHIDVADHAGLYLSFSYVGPPPVHYPDEEDWEQSDSWYES